MTTGAVKLGGIGATGLAVSALLGDGPADLLVNAGLIAGSANLVNLFDLRPGRAIKVAATAGTLLAAAAPEQAAVPLGAALGLLGEDLAERAMLGDAGANALGALLGTAAAASLPRPARIAVLAGIAGLTAASEVVSFTKVIERTPPLRWLDMLGRRPPAARAAARAGGDTARDPGLRHSSVTRAQAPPAGTGHPPVAARGMGQAAVVIGVITIVSNIVGFGRQLVFAHTVGTTCLGTAYATANQVPNIVYDVVLGGVLTTALVPVLAGRRPGGWAPRTRPGRPRPARSPRPC